MKSQIIILCALVLLVAMVSAKPGCKKCNRICTTDYRPVCGINRHGQCKTFANDCLRKVYNCENHTKYEWLKDGVCKKNCRSVNPEYDEHDC